MSKGTVFDIRRFSINDGPGIRTTVFMKGCPLSCWWCHNPESRDPDIISCSKTLHLDGKEFTVPEKIGKIMDCVEVIHEVLKDQIFYTKSGGGVTFSGGEPLFQAEFLKEMLKECTVKGISTAVDTSGFASEEMFSQILPFTNIFLYDIKIIDEAGHVKYTGVSNKTILENLLFLLNQKAEIYIRIPLIPGITDTSENIHDLISFLLPHKDQIKEINLLPWHNLGKSKYSKLNIENKLLIQDDLNPVSDAEIRKEFQQNGFQIR